MNRHADLDAAPELLLLCCDGAELALSWCAGGMSGLYHALTGCHLPGGRLEGVAEGNALGRGPVVFEVHASAIALIRKLAARACSCPMNALPDMLSGF